MAKKAKKPKKPSQWSKPLTLGCGKMAKNKLFPHGGIMLDMQRGYQHVAVQLGGFAPATQDNLLAGMRLGMELFKASYAERAPATPKKKGKKKGKGN